MSRLERDELADEIEQLVQVVFNSTYMFLEILCMYCTVLYCIVLYCIVLSGPSLLKASRQ